MDAQKYLNSQWGEKYKSQLVGCSAEEHVSHVLSARLSSRPMGWSYLGANQMASLRVHRANGVNFLLIYIKQSTMNNIASQKFVKQTGAHIAKAVGSSCEIFDNMPSLGKNAGGWPTALRKISNGGFNF